MRQSTISNNEASVEGDNGGSVGAGIMNEGDLVVDRSTISGNNVLSFGLSHAIGGGIYSGVGGTFAMTLSTVSGNTAAAETTLRQEEGGGISGNTPNPTITASTVASNSAEDGANLHLTATIQNTLIAAPLGGGENCGETTNTSFGFNLATDASCQFTQPTDLPSTPAGLMGLADNRGPTLTMALQDSSAAVDAGTSAGLSTDQRGFARTFDSSVSNVGDGSDIGAFELQPLPPLGTAPADSTPPNTHLRSAHIDRIKHKAIFRFSSSEPGSKFRCKLDKKPFRPCTSPKRYRNLKAGRHKFKVKAIDAAGNVDGSPLVKKFRI